jgi:phosphohistidine swiveling domain-containing protein
MPLTFSIARRGYELVYKSQGYKAGLNWYQLEANQRTLNAMIGIFAGRMYYNLLNWYKFIGLFPNNHKNQKYLDEQLQTAGETVYLPYQKHTIGYLITFRLRMLQRAIFFEHERKRYWYYLESAFEQYNRLPKSKDLVCQLERYAFIEQMIVPHMGRAADNDFFVMTYNGILKKKLSSWLGEPAHAKNDFLGAFHDVVSARQATLLMEIAVSIQQNQKAIGLLHEDRFEELDHYLTATPTQTLLNEYREKFLHRFAQDQKIEARNPLLKLDGFYTLIKTYMQLDAGLVRKRQKQALADERRKSRMIESKLGFIRRLEYSFLINRLKHHLRIREHNRLLRGKIYSLLRELFIDVGETMARQGFWTEANDVYYLDIDELFQLVDGSGYGNKLQDLISERKTLYKEFSQIEAPVRFKTRGVITELPHEFSVKNKTSNIQRAKQWTGTIASPGEVQGRVIVLREPIVPNEPFDILVVSHTDPGWTPLIALAKGLIVEHGGILSHAAIVTRELGIPSIIGIEGITTQLRSGQQVRLDANKGVVEAL